MSTCLVTGGAGFIGSHLVDKLIMDGYEVVVIDHLERQVHKTFPDYLNKKADYHYGRYRDIQLDKILQKTDYIFHCGSKVGVSQSQHAIYDFINKNINDTAYLLQKCINTDVKKIIFSGSMAPYGEGVYTCLKHGRVTVPHRNENDLKKKDFTCHCPECGSSVKQLPIDEECSFSTLSFYGITKQTQEEMIHLFGMVHNVDTISLRYFSVFGSRQAIGNPYAGPIPIFMENCAMGKDVSVFEDGKQTRDFVHVSDVIKANILGMKTNITQQSLNIATGKGTSIYELANTINNIFGNKSKVKVNDTYRIGDIRHSLANVSKAKKELGFVSTKTLSEGLNEATAWYNSRSLSNA